MSTCQFRGGGHCHRPVTDGPIFVHDPRTLCAHHYEMMCRERAQVQATIGIIVISIIGGVLVLIGIVLL